MKKKYFANQCCLFRAKMKNFIGVVLFSLAVLLNCIGKYNNAIYISLSKRKEIIFIESRKRVYLSVFRTII